MRHIRENWSIYASMAGCVGAIIATSGVVVGCTIIGICVVGPTLLLLVF